VAAQQFLPGAKSNALALAAAFAVGACSGGGGGDSGSVAPPTPQTPGNVLIIVADDCGTDFIRCYNEHPQAPPTPNIDALAADGVLFKNAYVSPTCSPTRAAIMTGRYPFRTGLGEPIKEWLQAEPALALDEVTLPEMLNGASTTHIDSAAFGKWHLSSIDVGDILGPNIQGFDWFEGTFGNFYFGQTYYDHSKIINGIRVPSFVYATTEQVDDAIARLPALQEPWLMYVGFNAAHQPFHAPPPGLHTYTLAGDPEADPFPHECATVQAVDSEIGRLLAALPPQTRDNTTIIFIGDNGSPNEAVVPPSIAGQSKGSLYEGGVNTPLIISGKRVKHGANVCTALVHAVDLFPTVADLFNVDFRVGVGDNRPIDGISLSPYLADPSTPSLRDCVFSQKFTPNGFGPYTSSGWMIRDARWKLIRRTGQPDALFDMQGVDHEGTNLLPGGLDLEQQAAYDFLATQLAAILGS
jgi:arylsulfatase A-like enzyme